MHFIKPLPKLGYINQFNIVITHYILKIISYQILQAPTYKPVKTTTMSNTLNKLPIFAVLVALTYGRQIVSVSDLCRGCTIDNGAGYKNHATDCDKYIQCNLNGFGVLEGEVRQCAFSTFWNNGKLTCLPVDDAQCDSDKCKKQDDGTIFNAEGNCRGYWECSGDRSVAMCCPQGQKYNDTLGCIDNVDNECMDSCFNDMPVEPEVEPEITCDKQEHNTKGMFQQMIVGFGWVPMPCAPGTEYVHQLCRCDSVVEIPRPEMRTCKAEVHLPFTTNTNDESGKGLYVANNNVDVQDGVAFFNGVNSSLVIPRFTNLDHITTVVIKAKYTSIQEGLVVPRAIVSNADCGNAPSILISEEGNDVFYGVGTTEQALTFDYMSQDPTTTTRDIVYEFDNGALTFSSGLDEASKPVSGYLRNVKCGLQIGHAENMERFYGTIDEITIYLCNPKM